jgi:F0F1-type ATP synthase alpha subunit
MVIDDIPVSDVKEFAEKMRSYIRNSVPQFISEIKSEKKLTPENEEVLKKAIVDAKA